MGVRRIAALAAGMCSLAPFGAHAFTIDTRISDGCHERMTLAALQEVGWPEGQEPPALSELERRILADLTFEVPASAADPWALALLIGVRDNDLKGVAPSDLPGISEVHNDPALQKEHCLRAPSDDGPEGDQSALTSCRNFILSELIAASSGTDVIDLEATVEVSTYLAFRERTDIPVRRFAFHLGRALHALQDSFSHSFRAPGEGPVRHVLNFVDFARRDDFSEARDGHRHLDALDSCDETEAPAAERARAARAATVTFMRAVLSEVGGHEGRMARAESALDELLLLEPGCTAENRWCGAAELREASGCGCRVPHGGAAPELGALMVLCFLGLWRRRRMGLAALGVVLFLATPVFAEEVRTSTPAAGALGLQLAGSAALDRGAFAGAVGVRWRVLDELSLGVDAEWNPWFSLDAGRMAPGAFNLYATGVLHWASLADLELRSTARLGTSVLLFDLVGADAGSTGLYVGLSLLGIAVKLSEHLQLVFDPADLAFPMPQLRGVPFYYRQYRITLGIQWNP